MRDIIGYVVFTDLKGFSKMNEPEIFYEHTIRPLAKKLKEYKYKAEVWNTWGDALVAVFKNGVDAVELMIEYRDFFRKNKLLSLQPRIAGHFGQMLMYNDPMINNIENVLGDTVNTAARIEPITFPGEIYVSSDFFKQIGKEKVNARDKQPYSQFEFTDLGEWNMAKDHGEIQLYRVFHVSEESWNINSLFVKKKDENIDILFNMLNIDKKVKEARKNEHIVQAKKLNTKKEVQEFIEENYHEIFPNQTEENLCSEGMKGPLYIALAELYRDIGDYQKALEYIKRAQAWQMPVLSINDSKKYWTKSLHDVELFPFLENSSTLKLEADILSKSGKFPEAKNILTRMLQQNPHETDTLNKLAAQLKREAFQTATKEEMDDLLEESLYLYLEAFRRQRDYYPAINAAYIEKILGKSNGWHLASYIFNTWKHETGSNWWVDSTLAETQLLLGEFKFCYQRMERAVTKHNPAFFERHATSDQIEKFIEVYEKRRKNEGVKSLTEEESLYAALLSILLYDPTLIKKYKEDILKHDKEKIENIRKEIAVKKADVTEELVTN